jgi:hypothetical protein
MAEEETPPACRVCGRPIEPGDNVVFTAVLGEVETVHLECAPKARHKKPPEKKEEAGG